MLTLGFMYWCIFSGVDRVISLSTHGYQVVLPESVYLYYIFSSVKNNNFVMNDFPINLLPNLLCAFLLYLCLSCFLTFL